MANGQPRLLAKVTTNRIPNSIPNRPIKRTRATCAEVSVARGERTISPGDAGVRSPTVTRLAAVLAAVSLALIDCGGATSDSAQVRSVVQRYIAAFASGNGSEACSLLTGDAEQQVHRAA